MKTIRTLCAMLALLLLFPVLVACEKNEKEDEIPRDENTGAADMAAIAEEINFFLDTDFVETDEVSEYVMLSVRDYGNIVLRLRADIAPITVKNFQNLVGQGFYNGLTFHRVVKNFMIQGGDPKGNGTGSSNKHITGEFSANKLRNELSHSRGVISMARSSQSMDSASCQFFICHDDVSVSLDGKYAAFGYVVAGLNVVDDITDVPVKFTASYPYEKSVPTSEVVIEKACFVAKK